MNALATRAQGFQGVSAKNVYRKVAHVRQNGQSTRAFLGSQPKKSIMYVNILPIGFYPPQVVRIVKPSYRVGGSFVLHRCLIFRLVECLNKLFDAEILVISGHQRVLMPEHTEIRHHKQLQQQQQQLLLPLHGQGRR